MFIKKKNIISVLILSTLFFILGNVSGYIFYKHKKIPQPIFLRYKTENFKFINPLLLLQVPEDESTPEFQSLKKDILNYVNDNLNKNTATDISVYFRDLNSSRWIGINADDKYSPASMLKVTSLIAYFRSIEKHSSLLSQNIYINNNKDEDNVEDYFSSKHKIVNGATYTPDELLSYMIVDSDNNALQTINALTGDKILNDTYTDLRIPISDGVNGGDFLSVKMYSRIFRALYNGTYISQELSEKALELLSKTKFTSGLVAGVPSGVLVAHKFGERTLHIVDNQPSLVNVNQDKIVRELHDCGIVYLPQNPYFICVMTKGKDFSVLQKIISDISGMVWQKVKNFKD